ncbi:MAG TPA: hypothetical protein DF774_08450 [Rheinheimera sp.]|uniref:sigma-70 family RNA polymerase sigma factor n=1 Tax=Rheinheimera sp. TaxID=1869214 RepID=UPI000ED97AF1|nr:sigma-70 family RNA polymerase sigma factor [Rheinheimera sp.]HCU65775.1 hypothetical protein [Rheinheimera sp.]
MQQQELSEWQDFVLLQNKTTRDKLFARYQEWAYSEARQWQRQIWIGGLESADYLQYAATGLLEAISQYDPELGIPFQPFARFRVKGTILNEIFRFSEKSAQWVAGRELYQQQQDLSADPLGLVMARIEELAVRFLLHDVVDESPKHWVLGQHYSSIELNVLKQRLLKQLLALEEPAQSIMLLHYQFDVSFTEIAEQLQLSKGRISQIHKQVIEQLLRPSQSMVSKKSSSLERSLHGVTESA